MPPCMQTSVAPAAHACVDAVADLGERERVRVGVGTALGERAEPAAGVTDVGEVDVAGDDVGHVVADGVAPQVVGEPDAAPPARRRRRAAARAPRRRTGRRGRARRCRSAAATSRSSRAGAATGGQAVAQSASQSPYTSSKSSRRSRGTALGVDGRRAGPYGPGRPSRRRAPARAARAGGRPRGRGRRGSASAATWARRRGSSQGSPRRTYSG